MYRKIRLLVQRVPVIIKSMNIGSCVEKWTWDYLKEMCGSKSVKVHVSSNPKMDFIKKNFLYRFMLNYFTCDVLSSNYELLMCFRTLQFDDFISRIESKEQSDPFISMVCLSTWKIFLQSYYYNICYAFNRMKNIISGHWVMIQGKMFVISLKHFQKFQEI